jgi:hypothetical protein
LWWISSSGLLQTRTVQRSELHESTADFDGDQLNGILSLDWEMNKRLEPLASHLSLMDLNKPYSVSRDVALPAPILATLNHWLQTSPAKGE